MYNFNHLYYFYVTAKSGGVTEAASHLRVSQPSLSSQLKVLERNLGTQLFRKVGRNKQLTEEGGVIYGFCRQMFEVSEQMEEQISRKIPTAIRRIHIGVSDEVDRPFVVEIISLFLKKHGSAQRPKVTLISGETPELIERLRFRDLDVLVTESGMSDPDIINLENAEVPVVLACSNGLKSKNFDKNLKVGLIIKDLMGGEEGQWVMPSPKFKLRGEIERFFEKNDLKARTVFESDVMASLVRSVIDEIGFSFLPLIYIAREVREKSVRVLGPKGGYWKYRVSLACHKQSQKDELIRTLASSFNKVCRDAIS